MTYNLQLKKFDMKMIPDESVVVMIGKRNTGKSFLTRDFLYHHRDIPVGTIISGTESANKFYSKMIPPIFIYDEYDPIIIENFVKRQKKITKLKRKEEVEFGIGKSTVDNRGILLFDDLMDDAHRWSKDRNVRKVFIAGRHFGVATLVCLQFPLGIPTTLRTNIDFVFVLRENIMSNRKRLYDNYCGCFPTFQMFNDTMNACTQNYECLVINNMTKSNRLEDQIYYYKADSHEDFRLGPPEIWKYCEEHYNNISSDEEFEDVSKFHDKKKGPKLNVKKL